MKNVNLRRDIETALAGGVPDRVPFSFYDSLYPPGFDPRPLQAKGLAVSARRAVFTLVRPNVRVRTATEASGAVRTWFETPVGTLTELRQRAEVGLAYREHLIKTLDDYRAAEFLVLDTRYEPDYERFEAERWKLGDAGLVIGNSSVSPLLDLQTHWIGQEQFCYELADHEDALMDLYELMRKKQREMFAVVAASPADYVLYDGNLVPVMVGPERVRTLIAPCWDEFAALLHERGKKMGGHLDAENRLIMDIVARSPYDFIEAFTPPPDCGVPVAEARAAWPGKPLWINFPSSVHLRSDEVIREATREILRQAGDRRGFLMGVTEDVPPQHINRSFGIILDVLAEERR